MRGDRKVLTRLISGRCQAKTVITKALVMIIKINIIKCVSIAPFIHKMQLKVLYIMALKKQTNTNRINTFIKIE